MACEGLATRRSRFGARWLLIPILAFALVAACSRPEPPRQPGTRAELERRGGAAYEKKDWSTCATLFEQAEDAYNAACCHALAGAADRAFAALARAIDDGFDDVEHLEADTDLTALHGDPRWTALIAALEQKTAAYRATLNTELAQIFEDDQADRSMPYEQIDWKEVGPRDKARERRVDEILAAGGARVADDYYHAAMVCQHGDGTAAIARAHELALKAIELDPRHRKGRWLAAASEDRLLVRQGRPQKWGTQYSKKDGTWVLDDVDPTITDEQRAEWEVPPLAEARAQADRLNQPPEPGP